MNTIDVEALLSAMIGPSMQVLFKMAGLKAELGTVEKRYTAIVSDGLTTVLGITGQCKGRFLLNMSLETARAIAQRINQEEFEYIDDTVLYSITELTNIVSGKIITLINDMFKEYKLRLTPPGVFCGQGIEITSPSFQALSVILNTEVGPIDINIGLEGVKF